MEQSKVRELQDVVIRFSGDSGDGMQLTGTTTPPKSAPRREPLRAFRASRSISATTAS